MKAFLLSQILVLASLFMLPTDARACSCARSTEPLFAQVKKAESGATAVFSGTVVEIVNDFEGEFNTVRLKVNGTWKGDPAEEVTLLTGGHDGNCRYPFDTGKTYLVYASNTTMYSATPKLSTHMCFRTALLSDAEADLKVLGKPNSLLPPTVRRAVPETANVQTKQSDRQFDGLKGAVKSVLVERADAKVVSNKIVEGKRRRRVEFVEYEETGKRRNWLTYHWQSGALFDSTSYKWVNGEKLSISNDVESKDKIIASLPDNVPRKPADASFGFKLKYKYDMAGKVTEEAWWRSNGDLWLRYLYRPVEGGREELVYDAKGDLNQKYKYLLDSKGNDVEMLSYNTETGEVEGKEKYAYSAFDSFGNWTKRIEWEADKDGKFVYKIREVKFRTLTYF